MKLQRKVYVAFLLVGVIVVSGTIGYHVLMGWSLSDSLYMTLITVTTIGYNEVHPLNTQGRILTQILILFGVGSVLYAFTVLGQFIVEGQIRDLFRRNRMEKKAANLTGHVIVCGYGRMGRIVADELRKQDVSFVIIEHDADVVRQIIETGMLVIEGDATSDEVLRKAGLEHARAVVCVVESDAENLYITLSARVLNREVFILARCNEEAAEEKLRRAGANKVIFPYRIGARQMTEFIVRPNIMEFLEMAFHQENIQLELQEVRIPAASVLDGVTLLNSGLRQKYNVIVVGIRKPDSHSMLFNPGTDSRIEADDILIVLGEPEKMDRLLAELGGDG